MRLTSTVCLALLPISAQASFFDDLPDLQGMTVVYAGKFENLPCPASRKYDCASWPIDFLKTSQGASDFCFAPDSYVACSYSCKGILAVGRDDVPYFFVIANMGGELKKSRITTYKCPNLF